MTIAFINFLKMFLKPFMKETLPERLEQRQSSESIVRRPNMNKEKLQKHER